MPKALKRRRLTLGVFDKLEAEFLKERVALEVKYQQLYQPLYAQRYEIVNGIKEVRGIPTDIEDQEKGIPNFWLTTLKNNEVVAYEIFEKDEDALRYLRDIRWSKTDNPKGFKIDFFFYTNPYFKNSILTKIYHLINEEEPILEKATSTKVEWYPHKCLTSESFLYKDIEIKIKGHESFFDFFNPPPVPRRRKDLDEDVANKLKKNMEQDYYVGATIRDKIIPHAIKWFIGKAQGNVYDLDDNEDVGDEDEDYSEEDDDSKDI
ncbi:nucleosome assembly protein 1;2-like [Punica granatum]|uniref:Nucleosome assembly protein 12-like n=1 Tax=Punica granatum TaxID=22663 RepID=A0A6P8C9C7_PUNGR|nr:nucleosome assembly protein 1;2-like [Punica granatum]